MEIAPDTIIAELLKACPSAEGRLKKHVAFKAGTGKATYYEMNVFSHHVVESYAFGLETELPAFFATLERLIDSGDIQTRELAIIGLVEDIQNIATDQLGGYEVFEKWLGPQTRKAWTKVSTMWVNHYSFKELLEPR